MAAAAPALSRVLCATDLSEFGDRAVPFALAELVLGSAADHVLHHAHRPVLLIPAPLEG